MIAGCNCGGIDYPDESHIKNPETTKTNSYREFY